MEYSREHLKQGDPNGADDARFRARAAGLTDDNVERAARETEVVTMERALHSGAVILERLPDGRAWVLRENVLAEVVRTLCAV
ncbi:hypothetical protein HN371_29645 [Candidatus Poribacteria bacterium]|jgi:hypothetical protein|nr:hypothetical protein [Candidatus Poribacteria bacterium]MBT5534182.1 hypothetical protein [Candidatus Poribacteria bacterium]MBT5710322.1 hypothetical protein [Candidatus Poribacteria bacterium]MBT7101187.1 hypothetical protein [Candidatus Poribacteria bacterium]MBT7808381.1 hypothetical protein [Candidatus Poribacteria bacterium]